MSEQKNVQTIQDVYAAFGRGDVPYILERLTDDVTWGIINDGTTGVPWHAQLKGRGEVPRFFGALVEHVEFTRFEGKAFAAGGDYVYSTIEFDVTIKKNGRKASLVGLHRFTFKNGRISEWKGMEDTAHVIALWK
jgi:ketosteroid isomerase-like protein